MKSTISKVEVFGVAVPLVGGGFKNAYVTKTVQKSAVIRITDDEGRVGLGNIDPSPGYSAESIEDSLKVLKEVLAPSVIGLDAFNIHELLISMNRSVEHFYDAKAAIEMACTDLICRKLDVPVYTYLGGEVVDEVLFNAWIGILPPDEAAAEAKKWFDKGFKSAKVKVGGNIQADKDRIAAIREAVGSTMKLRADANAGYQVEEAIALGRLLEPFDLQLFEQPVHADDLVGMAKVRQAVGIPIMADESIIDHESLIAVIKEDAADIVKLKVMKQGGFLNARRMLETASAAGLKVVIGHGFGLGINTVAEIMFACTSPDVLPGLECVGPLKTVDDIVTQKLDISSGSIPLPHGPGLGVILDDEKIRKYTFYK
ncbi:mandelate racemase/muconate lactonizing enzyme family protein [Polynucleobacter sinensis]|uniref:mandelate racemase/muconate lactonizing enzyme family protein n=1 Tax=Polynucleobacter sinensis TaxID=1743157 RepID=UPI0007817BFF|nr:mandelate racemase/muconate lactonizing enzyme family protein [Polynucleobacter sinensis]